MGDPLRRPAPHPPRLLGEIRRASLAPQLVRLHHSFGDEPVGFLCAACLPA